MQSRKCRNKTEQDKIMEPSRVSLIDLKHQFPFEIDAEIKDRICFAETLVISCGHYEGEVIIDAESLQTEWTCEETESHEETEESKEESVEEVKDYVEQETPEEPLSDSEDNFHFYFYHDCSKPKPPINSDTSIITIKGIPEENPAKKLKKICTCPKDRKGECTCFTKIPCYCGAKVKKDCTCAQLETVCICDETKPPAPVCTCDKAQICICHPDGKVRPVCDCEKVEKPCVCCQSVGISPSPVCTCKHKPEIPKKPVAVEEVIEESDWVYEGEIEDEFETFSDTDTDMTKKRLVKRLPKLTKKEEQICTCKVCGVEEELEPCTCQQPEKKPYCECLKDKKCTCGETICVCGIRKTCVCEPGSDENVIFCVDQDDRSICSCPNEPVCTCDKFPPYECECFKIKETECTCGDRENCICFHPCECPLPCTCDTTIKKDICTCLERQIPDATICTCPEEPEENRKLIKLRAGKVGYRWCREVDPKHTYFDYAYGRHDKISYKEQMKEKFKILGLHDGKDDKDDECPVHGVKAPAYVKKVRRPSLDCCSAVGGISISIETLGADKDKFLVQVVSNSSKEGAVTGSKLVAIVDCKLHTMEENRIEYISNTKSTKTRKSYIAICENGYFNKITRICGDKKVVKRLYHSFEESRKLLLEGANMVLLRYFALSRYKGNIKTSAVLIDGMVCQSIYVCHGVSQGVVNGKPMFVVKIERHLIQPSGIIYQTLSVMTLKGYFISHEWADSNYVMHINPLLHVDPVLDEIESHAPLRERWREDLQLFSDYLDFKSVRTSEGGRYVRENGDLTNTIRDYLQALLLLKPQDAIHFTRHYFGSCLSALDLPHNEFFDAQTKHVRYYFFEE